MRSHLHPDEGPTRKKGEKVRKKTLPMLSDPEKKRAECQRTKRAAILKTERGDHLEEEGLEGMEPYGFALRG